MPARRCSSLALPGVFLVACGGEATPPPEPPPRPAPIVAWTPPVQTAAPARAPTSPPPRAAAPSTSARTVAAPAAATVARAAASTAPSEPSVRCSLAGHAAFPMNTVIQSAEGRSLARFSGGTATVSVSDLTLATSPRARLETGAPRGAFRLRGFVDATKLPLFTKEAVAISAGHLWIGDHRPVTIAGVSSDKLKIQRIAAPPLQQTFTAWTSCPALSLDAGTPVGWSPPGEARGFALRGGGLELFDAPQGISVGVVHKAPESSVVLFFSTEQSGGFVHVERHGDIVVNAWAKASELSALPRGETMDQLATLPNARGPARLALASEPRVVRTTREVPLRASAKDTDAPIGVIGADTETYVLDLMAGWVSVLPKAMDVMPAEGGQFWAKKSDLGL